MLDLQELDTRAVGIVAYPTANIQHEVSFDKGVLPKFSKLFVDQVNLKMEARGSTLRLEHEEFDVYLTTLLYNRILVGRYEKCTLQRNVLKRLLIPAIYHLALLQIGEVVDRDTLEKFVPAMKKPKKLFNDEEMRMVSDKLEILCDFGFECNPGFSFEANGNLHFMTWSLVNGNFFREDKTAPKGLGVLQAFFEIQQVDGVIRKRICYGMKSYYDDLLHSLIVDSLRRT